MKDDVITARLSKKDENEAEKEEMVATRNHLTTTRTQVDQPASIPPTVVTLQIDVIALTLFTAAFMMRFWRLNWPPNVVFDEFHYGKYVSLYRKGVFYFDAQPPLGIQLISLAAYVAGYDGDNEFKGIGAAYASTVPLKSLRFVPAFCGSLIPAIAYHFLVELGFPRVSGLLAGLLIIFETSLLTQSRFMLMDTILIAFILYGLYSFLKFRKQPFLSPASLLWLFISTTCLTLGLCVKFIGFTYLLLTFILAIYEFWRVIPNKLIKSSLLWLQSLLYAAAFIVWPIIVYSIVFYIHLVTLTRAGPHDSIMTSAFQASLEGGLASIIQGQPLEIVHGSQVTLRHTHGRTCWLHSHKEVYPIKYADNRGSSHQQQVTCYSFKDVNNWWIIKKPDRDDLVVTNPVEPIHNGDIVQIVHGMSLKSLNSHDVAAPMSPQHQEVACYIDYNISMPAQDLWRVELLNGEETNDIWQTIRSKVRLIHVDTSQALKFSGKQLPDWGYNQHEVVTDKLVNQDDTIWNVEEHRYTKLTDEKEREKDMVHAEFVPLAPTMLSFWEKMKELQFKMLMYDQDAVQDHMYACESPIDWLTLKKGIAYWVHPHNNDQIHLIGNLVLWYSSVIALVVYTTVFLLLLLRRRRKFLDVSEDSWNSMLLTAQMCIGSYLFHLVPYFFTDRPLFLHHYLPAVVFKIMVLTACLHLLRSHLYYLYVLMISFAIVGAAYCFCIFLPLSYGVGSLTARDILSLKWKETWVFVLHGHFTMP